MFPLSKHYFFSWQLVLSGQPTPTASCIVGLSSVVWGGDRINPELISGGLRDTGSKFVVKQTLLLPALPTGTVLWLNQIYIVLFQTC